MMPATIRNPMSVVKPTQTPTSPKTDGAHNRMSDDVIPTTIYSKKNQEISKQLKSKRLQKLARTNSHTVA